MDGNLTQEELDALLNGMNIDGDTGGDGAGGSSDGSSQGSLSADEIDAIGEVANICSGSSATNLSTVLNQRVNITTPYVSLESIDELINTTKQPCVLVQINYIEGISGSNIQILQEEDVKVITDLMLGGDGSNTEALGDELSDLHMSALCEAMNQMSGAAATSLYTMLNKKVDISPPKASLVDLRDEAVRKEVFGDVDDGKYVKVSFKLEIGDLVDSSYMQIYTLDFARNLYTMITENQQAEEEKAAAAAQKAPEPEPAAAATATEPAASANANQSGYAVPQYQQMPMGGSPMMANAGMMAGPGMTGSNMIGVSGMTGDSGVVVQAAEFNVFDNSINPLDQVENIGIINDVSLEIAVELGKTQKTVREILDFEEGTLIELNRLAGEMMDILVNGKVLAKGEIVVLEDKFAVQLKEIKPI
jgi:flagellar motor switch protein FliN/FliY